MCTTGTVKEKWLMLGKHPDGQWYLFRNGCGRVYDSIGRSVKYGVNELHKEMAPQGNHSLPTTDCAKLATYIYVFDI